MGCVESNNISHLHLIESVHMLISVLSLHGNKQDGFHVQVN